MSVLVQDKISMEHLKEHSIHQQHKKEKNNKSNNNSLFASLLNQNLNVSTNLNIIKNLKIETQQPPHQENNHFMNLNYDLMKNKIQKTENYNADNHISNTKEVFNKDLKNNMESFQSANREAKSIEFLEHKKETSKEEVNIRQADVKMKNTQSDIDFLAKFKKALNVQDKSIPSSHIEATTEQNSKVMHNDEKNSLHTKLDIQQTIDTKSKSSLNFENNNFQQSHKESKKSTKLKTNPQVSSSVKQNTTTNNINPLFQTALQNNQVTPLNVSRETFEKDVKQNLTQNTKTDNVNILNSQSNSLSSLLKSKLNGLQKNESAQKQIAEQFQTMMKKAKLVVKDAQNARLTANLHPKELGKISLSLQLIEGQLQGSIVVDNDIVHKEISSKLDKMVHEMKEEGYQNPKFNVNINNGSSQSNEAFQKESKFHKALNQINQDTFNLEDDVFTNQKEVIYA